MGFGWLGKKGGGGNSGFTPFGFLQELNIAGGVLPDWREDLTGSAEAWKMDESSGSIVGETATTTLAPYGVETYAQTSTLGYGDGVKIGNGGGFYKRSTTAALEPGTSDFNILVVEKIDVPTDDIDQITYATMIDGTASPGFEFSWQAPASNKQRKMIIRATDGTQVTIIWGGNPSPIHTAYNDGAEHTYELRNDRSGDCDLLLDGSTQTPVGSADISSLSGKSITSTGVGIGQDYRGAYRNNQSTIFFIRQKHTLT